MEAVLMRRPNCSRHAVALGLAALIAPVLAAPARAQHTPDPYNIVGEGNLGYENAMFPTYPNGAGFTPNQGVLQGRSGVSRANQFQDFIQELDGVGSDSDPFSARGRGRSDPYYRAHRQFDEAFNRVYAPNAAADKVYNEDKEARTKKYLEYLRESDPKRRAELYREYNKSSLKAARDFGAGSTRAALRGGGSERSATTPPLGTPPRRPATAPSSGRSRTTPAASVLPSETPEQILERSESMDRASRSPTPAPSRVPGRPVPR
jgi:hypothetical protein